MESRASKTKAQIQPLSAVLVTTVVIGSVSAAYVWGSPILEKQQRQVEFSDKEQQIFEVYQSLRETAQGGEGTTRRVSLNLDSGSVRVVPEQDYVDITFTASGQPYPAGSFSLIRGKVDRNLTWTAGSYARASGARSGTLSVSPVSSNQETTVRYRIEFRNLLEQTPSGRELRKVDLRAPNLQESGGDATLIFQNTGTETDSGQSAVTISTGEKIRRKRTIVQVIIQ